MAPFQYSALMLEPFMVELFESSANLRGAFFGGAYLQHDQLFVRIHETFFLSLKSCGWQHMQR